jgi:hypothetical protein
MKIFGTEYFYEESAKLTILTYPLSTQKDYIEDKTSKT